MRHGEAQGPDRGELLEAAVLAPLQAGYDELTRAEKKLASYVLVRPNLVRPGDRIFRFIEEKYEPMDKRPSTLKMWRLRSPGAGR